MMHKVDIKHWENIPMNHIFEIVKGKRLTKKDMRKGSINYIGATAFNNGVTAKIANSEHLHPAGTITVCYNGSIGQAFYQTEQYWASDDVNILYPKFCLTRNIANFLIPIIYKLGQRYAYKDKWTADKMANTKLPLPVNVNGKPDWQYIENYMFGISNRSSNYVDSMKHIVMRTKVEFDHSNWGEFSIGSLFTANNTGNILARDVEDGTGNTPYVTASSINNGVVAHIDASNYDLIRGHCLLVGGKTFTITYQKDDFVSNDSHNFFLRHHNENLTERMYLFIMVAMRASLRKKYSWGDAVTKDKMLADFVFLPMTATGSPDYKFMDNYILNVQNKIAKDIDKFSNIKA